MTRHPAQVRGLTIVELLVVIGILALLVGILLPALGAARRSATCTQNNTQVRGIHLSLVMYAQGNEGFLPGIDATGEVFKPRVEDRFEILLRGNYFTGEYLVAPEESRPVWAGGPVTFENYSYALLDIEPERGARYAEWRETLNTQAVAVSDRNTGEDAAENVSSLYSSQPGRWYGRVAWNDNHVTFESSHVLRTRYGKDGEENAADNLFEAQRPDDAKMIFSGP